MSESEMMKLLDTLIDHPETWHVELSEDGEDVLIVPGPDPTTQGMTTAELDAAYEKALKMRNSRSEG
jgi:hypothetical protein